MKSVSWISTYLDRARIMIYIKKMGSHLVTDGKKKGTYFAVWAPNAKSVSVVGDFNNWDRDKNPMVREDPLGIYTCFIQGVEAI